MKHKFLFSFLLCTIISMLASCSRSPTSPNGSGNLIQNSSFRSGSAPWLAGWDINDSAWVKVVSNSPSGSNSWSINLTPQSGPSAGGVATTFITGQSGHFIYTLSGWARSLAGWYWGNVSLSQLRNGNTISYKSSDVADSAWTAFTLTDTLDILPGDTLAVALSAPSLSFAAGPNASSADTASGGVLFNHPELEKRQ